MLTVAASGILADDTDANGDSLSAVLVGDVVNGVLSLSGDGAFTYQPNAGYVGTDTFTYLAIDGDLTSNLATVTIDVYAATTLSVEMTQQGSGNRRLGDHLYPHSHRIFHRTARGPRHLAGPRPSRVPITRPLQDSARTIRSLSRLTPVAIRPHSACQRSATM